MTSGPKDCRSQEELTAHLLEVSATLAKFDVLRSEALDALHSLAVDAVVSEPGDERRLITLLESDSFFRTLVTQMQEGAASIDARGTIVYANPRFAEMLDLPLPKLIGRTLSELTANGGRAVAQRLLSQAAGGPARAELKLLRADGRAMPVSLSAAPIGGEQAEICLVAMDLTETVASERRLRALIEHSADVIAVLDDGARLVDANPAGRRLMGWKVEEEVGPDLVKLIHPDDLPTFAQSMVEIYAHKGMHPPVAFRMATPDGTWVYLDTIANNQLDDPAIAGVVVNAHDISQTVQHVQMIETNLEQLIGALARASEYRDPYTAGHQLGVARLSRKIAEHLQLSVDQVKGIELGAHLHDIGKIAVPSEILAKPGRLSPAEYELVKAHPQTGYEILSGIEFPWPIADIALHHHERLDGSGYPDGLEGDAITVEVRIVAVADVVDAMASHRPYRPALGIEAAREEIRANAGRLYDRDVVEAALSVTAPEQWSDSPRQLGTTGSLPCQVLPDSPPAA